MRPFAPKLLAAGTLWCAVACLTTPSEVVGQEECDVKCDQKFEAGQVQHRLGQGSGAITGPEYHTDWYVNPCDTDHGCEPNYGFVEAALAAVVKGDFDLLASLTATSPIVELDSTRGVLKLLDCRDTAVQTIALPRSLLEWLVAVRSSRAGVT